MCRNRNMWVNLLRGHTTVYGILMKTFLLISLKQSNVPCLWIQCKHLQVGLLLLWLCCTNIWICCTIMWICCTTMWICCTSMRIHGTNWRVYVYIHTKLDTLQHQISWSNELYPQTHIQAIKHTSFAFSMTTIKYRTES